MCSLIQKCYKHIKWNISLLGTIWIHYQLSNSATSFIINWGIQWIHYSQMFYFYSNIYQHTTLHMWNRITIAKISKKTVSKFNGEYHRSMAPQITGRTMKFTNLVYRGTKFVALWCSQLLSEELEWPSFFMVHNLTHILLLMHHNNCSIKVCNKLFPFGEDLRTQ